MKKAFAILFLLGLAASTRAPADAEKPRLTITSPEKVTMKEDLGKEECAAVTASLQKALAQLHVKRRRHS